LETPERHVRDPSATRPVEVDADEVHALDADGRAARTGRTNLDVLGRTLSRRSEQHRAVALQRDVAAAVSVDAPADVGHARQVRLVRSNAGVAHDGGELCVEWLRDHRPAGADRAAPGKRRRQRDRGGALLGPREVSDCGSHLGEGKRGGRRDRLVYQSGGGRCARGGCGGGWLGTQWEGGGRFDEGGGGGGGRGGGGGGPRGAARRGAVPLAAPKMSTRSTTPRASRRARSLAPSIDALETESERVIASASLTLTSARGISRNGSSCSVRATASSSMFTVPERV